MIDMRLLFVLLIGLATTAQAAPEVQSWRTQGGAKVMYVQAPTLPMVDVRVVFDAGSARDGDQPGLALFTNAVMVDSAAGLDADALAERLESHGIELGNGALRDMAWFTVRSLSEPDTLDVAIDSLAGILAEPTFAARDIERNRQQLLIGLRQKQQSPASIAGRAFMSRLYGDHPYGHDPSGEPASIRAFRRADLQAFHRRYYVAANAVIAIVGDLDRKAAQALAERLTARLPEGRHAPELPTPVAANSGIERLRFPSTQTHLYLGQIGMARHDPDYFALYVGNHVFGGGSLVSLLGEEVRNKRGLSYSVYSYFSPMRVAGPFLMVAQTKNAQADETIAVMRETLARFISEGPARDDFDKAKQNLVGGFPLKVSSNKQIVEYIAMMGFYDYPLDWLDTLTDKLEAVTLEQVRDAFRRRVDPQALTGVVVGGAAE